jgi:quercetin dioxygenase-like cupin family protein
MKAASDIFLFGDDVDIEDVQEGIKRQILGYNHEIMVVKVWFEAGAEGYQHEHRHSQSTYIVSGEFDVTIDGVTKRQRGGDGYYIPPHLTHGAICVESGILIDTFSPVREDFLSEE